MDFAVLGDDSESLRLAEAAVEAGHHIVWIGDFSHFPENWSERFQDRGDCWEDLFDGSLADAVILGRGSVESESRIDQLKQLAKNGIALFTTFPLGDSVLEYYEIDMVGAESSAVLHHFNPLVEQPELISRCAGWVREGHPQLGNVEQVLWTRPLEKRTRSEVTWHFARDVEFLGMIAGRLDRLGALGAPEGEAAYAGLNVQLIGRTKVPVRWSVVPVEQSESPQLTLIAESGRIVATFDEGGRAIQIQTFSSGREECLELPEVNEAERALARFASALQEPSSNSSTWSSALRAMELTDTIEISLRRGRMIDVHPQQLTEQLSFKGTMSAVGCGVLTVLIPLLLALGWLAEQVGIPVARYWPHVLLIMLAFFLALQVLPKFLFNSSQDDSTDHSVTAN